MIDTRPFLAALILIVSQTVAVRADEDRWLEPDEIPAVVDKILGPRARINLCYISVYVTDRDPKGLNVRAAPSRTAPVIGHMPASKKDEDDGTWIGPQLQVIAYKDGWFLARDIYASSDDRTFTGFGWISKNLVSFSAEDLSLRTLPRAASPILLKLLSGETSKFGWGPSEVSIERIHSCSGSFVDVDLETPDGKKARGWVTGTCSNQQTTCGGGQSIVEDHDGQLE